MSDAYNINYDKTERNCLYCFVFVKKTVNLQAEKNERDVAQFGSALRSGRRGRWFESSHPDRKKRIILQVLFFYNNNH